VPLTNTPVTPGPPVTHTVRPATEADADAVARLAAEFVAYLCALGAHDPTGITAEEYRRDGFGTHPAFAGLVAEDDEGEILGYLLHHEGYDIEHGGRVLIVLDLFVTERARRRGAGRALMYAAADACRRAGGHALLWSVYPPNTAARAFYERLGASYAGDLMMSWQVGPPTRAPGA
jgi:GNAT superfamily N-acetyltransferase